MLFRKECPTFRVGHEARGLMQGHTVCSDGFSRWRQRTPAKAAPTEGRTMNGEATR